MKTVCEFPLLWEDYQTVSMPLDSKVLAAQVQGRIICIWALVDPGATQAIDCPVWIHGTGHPVGNAASEGRYVASVQLDGGSLVFHVFVGAGA